MRGKEGTYEVQNDSRKLQRCRLGKINGDGFIIVYLGDGESGFELELTWLEGHPEKYNLGECEFHLAFEAEDFEAAHKLHEEMGCICYENPAMGIYFIIDPDGYWLEVVPKKNK